MQIIRDGPRRHDTWPDDMRRVRDSAFDLPPKRLGDRLTRRRRYHWEAGRYPHLLTRHECWTARAELDGRLVGYAWAYRIIDDLEWAYIDDVAVHASHQGHGIGGAVIDELVAWLHESGIEHITGLAIDGRMARIFRRHSITAKPPSSLDPGPPWATPTTMTMRR